MTRRFALVLSAILGVAPALRAAPSAGDKATAQTLFDDALKLLAAKDYEAACKKLEESNRLDPAMGTKYRLGECYEHIGRTASAWAIFREVVDEAKATNQPDREKRARERASKLEPKLARLTITAPKGVEVKRDGTVVGEGQLGVAVPIDPGKHAIEASAPQKKAWSSTVDVAAASSQSITVPALDDAPAEKVETKPKTDEPAPTWQKPTGLVVAGVGVVTLGISTVLVMSAKSKMRDSESHCVGSACDPEGTDLRSRAVSGGNLATGFFVGGLVLAAGGAVLYLSAPSDAPRVGFGPGSIHLSGSF